MPSQKDLPNTNWYYLGQDGEAYGPNSALSMIDWCRTGYFKDNVYIRAESDSRFYTLAEWVSNCGNQIPFLFPITSMNSLIGRDGGDSTSPPNGAGSSSSGDSPNSTAQHFRPMLLQPMVAPQFMAGPQPFIIVPQAHQPILHFPPGVVHIPPPMVVEKSLPKTKWYYIGQDGESYGPNSAASMMNWVMSGYFSESVLMRTENDDRFYMLSEWILNCGNQIPFLHPVMSMSSLNGGSGSVGVSPPQSNGSASSHGVHPSDVDTFNLSRKASPSETTPAAAQFITQQHILPAPQSFVMVNGFSHPPPPFVISNPTSTPSVLMPTVMRQVSAPAPTIVAGNTPIPVPVGLSNVQPSPQYSIVHHHRHQPPQFYQTSPPQLTQFQNVRQQQQPPLAASTLSSSAVGTHLPNSAPMYLK